MATRVRFENWKGKRVAVVRDNGKLLAWKRVRKGDTIESTTRKYKRDGTFIPDVKRRVEKFRSGTREIAVTSKSKIVFPKGRGGLPKSKARARPGTLRIDDRRSVQYVYTGKLRDGTKISARSQTFFDFTGKGKEEARQEAFENFILRLSNPIGEGGYDEDEGYEVLENDVVSVEEGYVFYDTSGRKTASS